MHEVTLIKKNDNYVNNVAKNRLLDMEETTNTEKIAPLQQPMQSLKKAYNTACDKCTKECENCTKTYKILNDRSVWQWSDK